MGKNFPNLMKYMNKYREEDQHIPTSSPSLAFHHDLSSFFHHKLLSRCTALPQAQKQ
jgi:hypothetical protein